MCSSWSVMGCKGLPEVVGNVWPAAIVQTCVIHLLRNTQTRFEAGLGRVEEGCETDLHGAECEFRGDRVGGVGGEVGAVSMVR